MNAIDLKTKDVSVQKDMLELKLADVYTRLDEILHLSGVQELLSWDQNVYMPPSAAEGRGKQLALISKLIHGRFTDQQFVENVNHLHDNLQHLSSDDAANVREIKRDLNRQIKLPSDFVAEQARVHSAATAAWEKAKPANDFQAVLPHLEKVFELARREAEYLGYSQHPYDALLDKYEPGASVARTKPLLLSLGKELATLIPKISAKFDASESVNGDYSIEKQKELGRKVAESLGYDFSRGRLDVTAHPFMCSVGAEDQRITTRYFKDSYIPSLYGTIHEAGHAIYEQGLSKEQAGRPLGQAVSLGIHESQSRLWENLVGKSERFVKYLHGVLQDFFPEEAAANSPEQLWRKINRVAPSLIRVEADEVTYSQHIIIRTLLEEELIGGTLKVIDLPKRWNELYKELLGIEPKSDKEGVMQDVHWFCGLVGYFPTYALGNLYGAAMMEKARTDLPNLDERIEKGDFLPLKNWLKSHVHEQGRRYQPEELVQNITGKGLSSEPFLNYIKRKFAV